MVQTITSSTTIDTLTSMVNAEEIEINGFTSPVLTIDVEPQEVLGVVNGVVDVNGNGQVAYDATNTRLLPYDGGSGTPTPVIGDTIEGVTSGATGEIIAFLDTNKDRNSSFQSTSGYLKLRSVSGGPFQDNETVKKQSSSGEWTGLANGPDEVGFLAVAQANGSDGLNTIEGPASVTMTGEWYYLERTSGVDTTYPFNESDGNNSQTWEWYLPFSLPCVWVETGDGTDIWEIWVNSRQTRSPTGTIAAVVDSGHRGADLFDGGAATKIITFGDGTNGNVPPAGARIRVPNLSLYPVDDGTSIHTPALSTSNGDDNISWTSQVGGTLTINKAILWGGHNTENTGGDLTTTDSAICWSYGRYYACTSEISLTSTAITSPPSGFSLHDRGISIRTMTGNMSASNCAFASDASVTWQGISGDVTLSDSLFIIDDTVAASTTIVVITGASGDISLNDCHSHNGYISTPSSANKVNIINHSYSAQTSTRGWEFGDSEVVWENLQPQGDTSNLSPLYRPSNGSKFTIKNIGTESSPVNINGATFVQYSSSYHDATLEVRNVFLSNTLSAGIYVSAPLLAYSKWTKVWQDYADGISFASKNMIVKAARGGGGTVENSSSSGGNINAASSSAEGSHFLDSFTSDTTGFLLFNLCRKTDNEDTSGSNVTYSGDYYFNTTNELVLRTTSSYAILEMPYFALGHDAFDNIAIDVAGQNGADESSHFTVEYQVDKGSGYGGTWIVASAANLSAETGISETTGIKVKIRVTPLADNDTTNQISAVRIWTTTTLAKQEAINYPEPTIPFTISGILSGSNYRIETTSGGTLLTSGTASATTVTGFIDTTEGTNVKLIIGKDDYLRFTGNAAADEDGTSFVVIQADDNFRVTDDTTALAVSGISIDGGAQTITITAPVTHQQLYDYSKAWSIQTTNLQYDVPITTVDGVTFNQTSGWSITVSGSGTLISETTNIDGTITVASGGFYEGESGAKWESSGSIYHGSHFWINVKDNISNNNIQDVIVGFIETDTDTDQTYNTSLTNGAFVTDSNGDVEGYAVWKVDATTYAGHSQVVGEYEYIWSNIPRSISGSQIGSSSSPIVVRLNSDSFVVKTKANALLVSGITTTHSTSTLDHNSNTLQDVYDNLKARQTRAADIEAGKPGHISFYQEGLIFTTDGAIFTQNSSWTSQNLGDTTNIYKGGTYELSTVGDNNFNFNGCTLDYTAASGTYDHRGETMDGSIELVNSGGGSLTVQLDPGVSYVNTGPNITIDASVAMPVAYADLINDTTVQVYNVTQGAKLEDATVSGGGGYSGSFTFGTGEEVEDGDIIRLRAIYVVGTTAKEAIEVSGIASSGGIAFSGAQEDNSIYNTNGVDGSSITKFTADYTNDEIDISSDVDFTAADGYAYFLYQLTTVNGIDQWWGGITALDSANYLINTSIITINWDNTTTGSVKQTDSASWRRDDGAYPVLDPTTSGYGVQINWQLQVFLAETGVSGLTGSESSQLLALGTAAQNAAAVWGEDISSYTTEDTAGKVLNDADKQSSNAEKIGYFNATK